ncbi:hypothetical protein MLD38_030031 [Melastoma candidum]|uniref:Uncharacterized protein n=1 Tax=Melastoma candidum TaxID=119954 RepID=A0ACB9MK38_9MYRT|nr:hypothetical protein MLD38_030031 [Melastoma candidum]
MGLLRCPAMLVWVLWWSVGPARVMAQSIISDLESARALDALLQDYAYRAFVRPRTGVPYDGVVPANLTGVKVSAMRLRNGSLRKHGVASYKEFDIRPGVIVRPYMVRLVLVYQDLGNWSSVYYSLPGYTYMAPVLGLLAYDASNLTATNLPELDINASGEPIVINFSSYITVLPLGATPKCIRFDSNGSAILSSLISGKLCSTTQQGHFSIVVESIAPSPAPIPSPVPGSGSQPPGTAVPPPPSARPKGSSKKVGKIAGSVIGGSALLVVLALLVLWARKHKQRTDIQRMERAADAGEALHMSAVGETRAPSATVTRTQPMLEHEYVP